MSKGLHVLFFVLVAAAIAQALWQHDRLPERVATHFNAAGVANGWMSRDAETAWHIGTVLFMAAMFESLAWLGPRLPHQYINLPHRDYWLAPEHRAATQRWLAGLTLGLGCALILFLIALFHLVYRANLAGGTLPVVPLGLLSAGLLLVVGFGILGVFVRFARPPA